MLRLTVLLLVLANGIYFAWARGLLVPWGVGPVQQSEPQRLGKQVRPEALRILGVSEAGGVESAATPLLPLGCLQSDPLEESGIQALRQSLQALPPESWTLDAAVEPARWIVYMGKYTAENLDRKKAELRQIGVTFETPSSPALEPGLALGGFASRAAARQHLERLTERGVQTAQVVQERSEVRGQVLRLPSVDETLRERLEGLKPALDTKTLRPCR